MQTIRQPLRQMSRQCVFRKCDSDVRAFNSSARRFARWLAGTTGQINRGKVRWVPFSAAITEGTTPASTCNISSGGFYAGEWRCLLKANYSAIAKQRDDQLAAPTVKREAVSSFATLNTSRGRSALPLSAHPPACRLFPARKSQKIA